MSVAIDDTDTIVENQPDNRMEQQQAGQAQAQTAHAQTHPDPHVEQTQAPQAQPQPQSGGQQWEIRKRRQKELQQHGSTSSTMALTDNDTDTIVENQPENRMEKQQEAQTAHAQTHQHVEHTQAEQALPQLQEHQQEAQTADDETVIPDSNGLKNTVGVIRGLKTELKAHVDKHEQSVEAASISLAYTMLGVLISKVKDIGEPTNVQELLSDEASNVKDTAISILRNVVLPPFRVVSEDGRNFHLQYDPGLGLTVNSLDQAYAKKGELEASKKGEKKLS